MVNDDITNRVLLVENEPHKAESTATQLAHYGFHCDTATGSADALQLLRHNTYRSAILDDYLHGETSEFLVAHLRLRHPQTRIIAITEAPDCANCLYFDRCSADFRFRKALPVSDLVEIIKYLDATSDWFDCPETGLHFAIPPQKSVSTG